MLISQVILPLAGPASELFLLYLLAVNNLGEAGGILILAAIGDLLVSGVIITANREPLRMIVAYVPLVRLLWRPLQLYAVAASMTRWLGGKTDGWRKVTRYNAVDARLGNALSTV